ncbi:hypothetical protein CCP3SC15_1050011 [Gammaproteobacteria bacterium]
MKKLGVYDGGMSRKGAWLSEVSVSDGMGRVLVMVLTGLLVSGPGATGSEG